MADLFDLSVRNQLAQDTGRRSVDGVARAIYMTHWKPGDPDSGRPGAPIWENASDNVRRWVTAQAEAVLAVPQENNPELPRHLIPAGEGASSGVSSLTLAGPSSEMAPAIPFGEAG